MSQRWLIATDHDAPEVFSTYVILPGSRCAGGVYSLHDGNNNHAPCTFVSKRFARQGWIYHATMFTPSHAIIHALNDWLEEKVDEVLGRAGIAREVVEPELLWVPVSKMGKEKAWTMQETPPLFMPEFGGKTIFGLKADLLGSLSQSDWPVIYYGAKELNPCPKGIDIQIIVNEEHLDIHAVSRQVKKFWEGDELLEPLGQVPIEKYIAAAEDYLATLIRTNTIEDLEYRSIETDDLESQ